MPDSPSPQQQSEDDCYCNCHNPLSSGISCEHCTLPQSAEDELIAAQLIENCESPDHYRYDIQDHLTVGMDMDALVAFIKSNREQYGREQRIASVQLYMDTCEENSCDPSWPTIHEFQDGQRKAMSELHPDGSQP